jgi:hypothetical protein
MVKAPRKKPDPPSFVQCRISIPEYEAAILLAKWAFEAKQIKSPTVSAITKASLITMINWYRSMLKQNQEVMDAERKRKEMLAMTGPSKMPYTSTSSYHIPFKL